MRRPWTTRVVGPKDAEPWTVESLRFMPAVDSEHEHTFEVTLRSFGQPDKTLYEAARSLAIMVHRMDPTDNWEITVGGRRVVFDHWAQDGNHAGHDNPLVVEEPR